MGLTLISRNASLEINQIAENLGVEADFSRVPLTHTVLLGVTDDRKKKLQEMLRGHFSEHLITRTNAQKLFGSARWVVCPIFGTVGLALLSPLRHVRSTSRLTPGSDLCECLHALHDALPLIQPVEFPLFRRKDHAIIILSDASWSANSGRMGLVLWCPYRMELFYSSRKVPFYLVEYFMHLQLQSTYICQAELLALVAAYFSYPELLGQRLIHHFVDNKPARSIAISGSSSSRICSRILHTYHLQVLKLACRPWIGFVYSEDNISDLPSRNDFALMRRLGATSRPMVLPRLDDWSC